MRVYVVSAVTIMAMVLAFHAASRPVVARTSRSDDFDDDAGSETPGTLAVVQHLGLGATSGEAAALGDEINADAPQEPPAPATQVHLLETDANDRVMSYKEALTEEAGGSAWDSKENMERVHKLLREMIKETNEFTKTMEVGAAGEMPPMSMTYPDSDLRPPVISPVERSLADLNEQTLDYSGNWDVRQHDSVITECGHSDEYYGNRTYFDSHVGAASNKRGGSINEITCELACFSERRKLTHNKVFQEIMGSDEQLHDCDPNVGPMLERDGKEKPCKPYGNCAEEGNNKKRIPIPRCTTQPRALFLIGVPASGKDAVLKELAQKLLGDVYTTADPDAIKTQLVKHGEDTLSLLVKNLQRTTRSNDPHPFVRENYDITQILAQHIHRESIILSYEAVLEAWRNCSNYVLQKTGTSWSQLYPYIKDAAEKGYEVHVYITHVHPFTNWKNHQHRVKHFLSAGRAMNRRQVLSDLRKFPAAVMDMLRNHSHEGVTIKDVKMLVYNDILAVRRKDVGSSLDAFKEQDINALLAKWMPQCPSHWAPRFCFADHLLSLRRKYREELNRLEMKDEWPELDQGLEETWRTIVDDPIVNPSDWKAARCWEANLPKGITPRCHGYTDAGYTCIESTHHTMCAAMDPSGTPESCAIQQPLGYVVDTLTGKCKATVQPCDGCAGCWRNGMCYAGTKASESNCKTRDGLWCGEASA